jgi:hypothetical protein
MSQDATAIVRALGKPDLFITITPATPPGPTTCCPVKSRTNALTLSCASSKTSCASSRTTPAKSMCWGASKATCTPSSSRSAAFLTLTSWLVWFFVSSVGQGLQGTASEDAPHTSIVTVPQHMRCDSLDQLLDKLVAERQHGGAGGESGWKNEIVLSQSPTRLASAEATHEAI